MNPMYAKYGLDIAQGVGDFIVAGINSKMERRLQDFRNKMSAISAAMSQNTIESNRIASLDAASRLRTNIQITAAEDQANSAVSAAAAGVRGGSVDATMRGLKRSAANAQAARKARLKGELKAHAQESTNVTLAQIMGKDISVKSRPSMLSSAMGLGTTLLDTWNQNQPEDDRLF